jgi:hypothetical protein
MRIGHRCASAKLSYAHFWSFASSSGDMKTIFSSVPSRIQAALTHLSATTAIAIVSALLVFFVWYPAPFEKLSGGAGLFLLIVACDIVLGPLLTLIVFETKKKSRKALVRDLACICTIQVIALVYGIWTMFVARPVFVSFEKDSFRVVHANEVFDRNRIDQWDSTLSYPLSGPTVISLRPFKDQNELFAVSEDEIGAGIHLSFRPELWQTYEADQLGVILASKPVERLLASKPHFEHKVLDAVKKTQFQVKDIRYLPIVSKEKYWTILLKNDTAQVLGYIDIDTYD